MRSVFAATGAFVLAITASPDAHRLDEYLQAARVSFARTGIGLELDLTPGATVADGVIALIDRDGDHRISPLETESYGRAVLRDVILELDGRPVGMALVHAEVPPIEEMRQGVGTIHLRATGDVEGSIGRHQVHVRNSHQASSSVYLVNALVPDDADVQIVAQTRDARQQDVRIDYSVGPQWPKHLYWPVLGAAALFLIVRRRTSTTNH